MPTGVYIRTKPHWNKGKPSPRVMGNKNGEWKGDNVGYSGLHKWIYRNLGKPDTCEQCGRSGLSGQFIQWANISGEYKRDFSDWIRLCAKCHTKFDRPWSTRKRNEFGQFI